MTQADKSTPNLAQWFATPMGEYVQAWEQAQLDELVADMFGFHALQMGAPWMQALRNNRMPKRWLAAADMDAPTTPLDVQCLEYALPFDERSLDAVVCPHVLEFSEQPHAALRELHRVLQPEGRLVLCGFNPASLLGLRQQRARLYRAFGLGHKYLPTQGESGPIPYWRMRDWLRLLDFDIEESHFGCYRPTFTSPKWVKNTAWMDKLGAQWWSIFGGVYIIVARKRVAGVRMMDMNWKPASAPQRARAQVAQHTKKTKP